MASCDVDADGRYRLHREAAQPPSNLVSMGVYVFSWPALRAALTPEPDRLRPRHPAGHGNAGNRVSAYEFGGYWEDVGTVESYRRANLDLLRTSPASTSTTAAG